MSGNVFEQLMEIPDTVTRIKAAIADLILNLPQNPRITPINSRCFTVQSSDLGGNWTPFYHDFKMQAELIAEAIRRETDPQFTISYLKLIVKNQSIMYKSRWYKFHPMFCNHLKTLIETYGVK